MGIFSKMRGLWPWGRPKPLSDDKRAEAEKAAAAETLEKLRALKQKDKDEGKDPNRFKVKNPKPE